MVPPRQALLRPASRSLLGIAMLSVAYFATARVGLLFATPGSHVSLMWPAAGLALAALVIGGPWLWPGIVVGQLLVTLSPGRQLAVGLVAALGNVALALAGRAVFRRLERGAASLERVRDVLGLTSAALVGATVGATFSALGLTATGTLRGMHSLEVWRNWWLGDLVGILSVAPVMLAWWERRTIAWTPERLLEAALLIVLLSLTSEIAYVGFAGHGPAVPALLYATYPFLIWAALRFGPRGASAVALLVATLALTATARGHGPFAHTDVTLGLLSLDAFVAVAVVTTLLLAAVVAERRRALDTLRASEARGQRLFDSNMVGIGTWRRDGVILEANDVLLATLGFDRADLADGRINWARLTPPEYREVDRRAMRQILAGGVCQPYEKEYLRRDGARVPVLVGGATFEGSREKGVFYVVDLSGRRQIEQMAEADQARFRALVENSSDVVALTDEEARVIYVSQSVERVLGYQPQELLGRRGPDFLHPEDAAEQTRADAERPLQPGQRRSAQMRARHKDGSWHTLEVTSVNRLDDPAVRAVVSNVRDVTDQRRLEDQLRVAQRMEAIGRLAGGVAHDFNNILTAIIGHLELLGDSLWKGEPAVAKELDEIQAAATRATNLTQQLLAFSRNQMLKPRVLDLNALIRDMQKLLRRLIGENISLEIWLDPVLLPVSADPSQLEQVIMNLVLNARDAMPEGGQLTISTANSAAPELTNVTGEMPVGGPPARYVRLTVRDTGKGMTQHVLEHLFEPFFTTKELGKGTGLGLATVYGIVRQSGGHVTADSQAGRGSTFAIYLPGSDGVPEPLAAEAAPAQATAVGDGSETVLLVEDDGSVRSVARRALERFGYRVLEAADGEAALAIAREHQGRIHLLLTDVVMPGMSGRRVAEELGQIRPDMDLLFMSGYTDDAILRDGVLEAGINFIQKPFTVDELVGKVRAVLGRS